MFDAGDPAEKEIILTGTFGKIEVENIFEITLIQDTINKAIIKCGENLISDVSISISDEALWLNHSITYNWTRDYKKVQLYLHLKSVPPIYIRKPASIVTQNTFKTKEFIIFVWGSRFAEVNACIDADFCGIYPSLDDFSKFTIKGKSITSDLHPCGSCYIDCRDLTSERCEIWQRSIADTYLNVTKELIVEFNGKGNIYYSGSPDSVKLINKPTQGQLIHYAN
jgi:hypothetical protein